MIAAIYARKSTDQGGVADEAKSVTRQIDHARGYAVSKGWAVAEEHVYVDDGISGAEFAGRPGFVRLMNALKPSAPFQVLVMSEESRLGREAIETSYALKQLLQAGVRVFFYLENRERTLDSPTDKLLLSVTAFADELEREKARQRTYDAMARKAKAGQVTGGRVFGYANIEIHDAAGHRSHVERRILPAEATVVRRIFELAVAGYGKRRTAILLNDEGASAPRPQRARPKGWTASSVLEILHRPLYRGEIVWNKSRKRDGWGRHHQQPRAEGEWLRVPAPELRVIDEALWTAAHARLENSRALYLQRNGGRAGGRPVSGSVAKYLLTGLARCGQCGGGLAVRSRDHGKRRAYRYVCSGYHLRGRAVCPSHLEAPLEATDAAILAVLEQDILRPDVLAAAIERARAEQEQAPAIRADRLADVRGEIAKLGREIDQLTAAVAAGGNLVSLLDALKAREGRLRALQQEAVSLRAAAHRSEEPTS